MSDVTKGLLWFAGMELFALLLWPLPALACFIAVAYYATLPVHRPATWDRVVSPRIHRWLFGEK